MPAPDRPEKCQLNNVTLDPGETCYLAGEKPELLKRLKAGWDEYAREVGFVLAE